MPDDNAPRGSALLRDLLERYETLECERNGLDESLAGILSQLKASGFDVKVFKALVKRRKQAPAALSEEELLLGLYERAVAEVAT